MSRDDPTYKTLECLLGGIDGLGLRGHGLDSLLVGRLGPLHAGLEAPTKARDALLVGFLEQAVVHEASFRPRFSRSHDVTPAGLKTAT